MYIVYVCGCVSKYIEVLQQSYDRAWQDLAEARGSISVRKFICVCVCIYIYTYIHTYTYMCVYVCVCI